MGKTYKKWSEAELNFIRDNSSTMKDSEMAVKLTQITGNSDISVAMIRRQRRKLNLAKTRGRRVNKVVSDVVSGGSESNS